MKKRLITAILSMVMILLLFGCGPSEPQTEEVIPDTKDLIYEAADPREALKQYGTFFANAETEEEKQTLETYVNEYFLDDLNGFFYYQRPERAIMHVDSDCRAILIKSKDEVYIAPYSEEELTDMGLSLEDISQLENSEQYKYHVAELKTKEAVDFSGEVYYFSKVLFESDYLDKNMDASHRTMSFSCASTGDTLTYVTYGYFADEVNLITELDKQNGWGASRNYYRDESTALYGKSAQDNRDKDWAKPQKKAEPTIGMTKEEITDSAWGLPEKKNVDEYEWGTEEQWVYPDKGYIYFENGVVTAIQHRE